MAFPKTFSMWPFPKTLIYTYVWFKCKSGFEQNQCFASKGLFHQDLFLHKNVLYTNTMFYTKAMFLLGLCKGCLRLAG